MAVTQAGSQSMRPAGGSSIRKMAFHTGSTAAARLPASFSVCKRFSHVSLRNKTAGWSLACRDLPRNPSDFPPRPEQGRPCQEMACLLRHLDTGPAPWPPRRDTQQARPNNPGPGALQAPLGQHRAACHPSFTQPWIKYKPKRKPGPKVISTETKQTHATCCQALPLRAPEGLTLALNCRHAFPMTADSVSPQEPPSFPAPPVHTCSRSSCTALSPGLQPPGPRRPYSPSHHITRRGNWPGRKAAGAAGSP